MKVVQMDDIEWWVGESLEACLAEGRRQCGADCYESSPLANQHELSDEALQRLKFVDEDGTERTFAEQLAIEVSTGGPFPRPFAATEW